MPSRGSCWIQIIFPEAEAEIDDLEAYVCKLKETELEKSTAEKTDQDLDRETKTDEQDESEEKEEDEYVKKDPIRKFQYDYTKTTCSTKKFPEEESASYSKGRGLGHK